MLLVTFCKALFKKSAFVGIVALAVFLSPQRALGQFTTASLGGMVRDSSGAGIPDADRECSERAVPDSLRKYAQVPTARSCFHGFPSERTCSESKSKGSARTFRTRSSLNVDQSANLAAHNSSDRAGHRRSDGHRHSGADHDANGDRHPDSRRAADCGTPSPRTEAGAADVSGGRDGGPGTQRLHYLRPGRLLPRRRDAGRERLAAGPGEFPARCHQP